MNPRITRLLLAAIILIGAAAYILSTRPAHAPAQEPQPTATTTPPTATSTVNVSTSLTAVASPLTVEGTAPGTWYFEASFPAILLDGNGKELARTPAQAQSDWMTTNLVPFKVTLTFIMPTTTMGTLVLKNDNPSGLPQNDKEARFPVTFKRSTTTIDSGIRGMVMIGPTCPVERIPPDPACADKPYVAMLAIVNASGTTVAQVTSNTNGTFSAALPPGTYTITRAGTQSMPPTMRPITVTVAPHQFTDVTVQFDSGIR